MLYHPPEYEGPILFSFREKAFFGKKKAAIRVDSGEWCDRFSLDVAGSSGVVECKANNITYLVSCSLSSINIVLINLFAILLRLESKMF